MIDNLQLEGVKFKNYDAERLYIKSIYSKLSLKENKVRRALMEYTINNAKAFNINSGDVCICEALQISMEELKNTIYEIREKQCLVFDEDENINFIYPVCALPTNHRVTLEDGRNFYAMCAVDAMGTSFTFKQDISITSICSKCGEKVKVELVNGKIKDFSPKNLHILHVDLNKHTNWSGNC